MEQLLTSEHLEKMNVKKEDSQEEKAKIIKEQQELEQIKREIAKELRR